MACVVGLLLGVTSTASAKTKTLGVTLRCTQSDGLTANTCFTLGQSADGGGKSIKLDTVDPAGTTGVAFDNWWCQRLENVQQLKISTQDPVTAGSPRISILLSSDVTGPAGTAGCNSSNQDGHTLFLSPLYCASANSNGWRMSNWRSDTSCTIFDENGVGYAGWNAYTATHPNEYIWFAFVVQDGPPQPAAINYVDRIQLDSQLFTK
jgi:hypothetical protein